MPFYILSVSDYDSYGPRVIEGPKVADWEAMCKSLIPVAVEHALNVELEPDSHRRLSWDNVVDSMIVLLAEAGFQHVRLPEMCLDRQVPITAEEDTEHLLTPELLVKLSERAAVEDAWMAQRLEEGRLRRQETGELLAWERPLEYRIIRGEYTGQLARFAHRLDDRIALYLIGEGEENFKSVYLIDHEELEVEKITGGPLGASGART